MWQALTADDIQRIQEILDYFKQKYPDIPSDKLYDRIYNGYCWGEGGLRIISIEDWEQVFSSGRLGKLLFTCFDSWEEYDKYQGDWHKKIDKEQD